MGTVAVVTEEAHRVRKHVRAWFLPLDLSLLAPRLAPPHAEAYLCVDLEPSSLSPHDDTRWTQRVVPRELQDPVVDPTLVGSVKED